MAYREYIRRVIKPIYWDESASEELRFDGVNSSLKMPTYNPPNTSSLTPEQIKRAVYALGVFMRDDGTRWFMPGFFVEPEGEEWLSSLIARLEGTLARRYW